MLQPLDVAVFYPLKQNWRKLVKKWRIENYGKEITKYNLPSALYSLIINNETFANNIKAGFKTWFVSIRARFCKLQKNSETT